MMAEAPKMLMRYLVNLEEPISKDTFQEIVQHLKGVGEDERDRRAIQVLEMLKNGVNENTLSESIQKQEEIEKQHKTEAP